MNELKRNGSGYVDPTAYKAIKNIDNDRNRAVNQFIQSVQTLAHLAGFEIIGRIQLRDKKTGREWR